MGALNDGVTERCGRVRGVIHEMWIVDKAEHPAVQDLKVVSGPGLQVLFHEANDLTSSISWRLSRRHHNRLSLIHLLLCKSLAWHGLVELGCPGS